VTQAIGTPLPRVDGRAKVTGSARYAADFNQQDQAYAVIVGASVGLGRITAIDAEPVMCLPGVIALIDHRNAPRLVYGEHKAPIDPTVGERLHVLQDDQVRFYGQPVAVVVAESVDQAERAALALKVTYEAIRPVVDPSDPRACAIVPEAATRAGSRIQADAARGDAEHALSDSAVTIDAKYEIARQNLNPMEPHATISAWEGDKLTLWSKSQFVTNEREEIAAVFGLSADNVKVICPFVGGAFGTSLRTWPHVTLSAIAALAVRRPVKLVLTRKQMFFATGHRPHVLQRLAAGAQQDGKLTALVHEATGETSRYEQFIEAITPASSFLYSCPNVRTRYRLLPLDTSSPNHMRGPGEASGIFALESAMDELSYALGIDPLELRRRNEPKIDESESKPFSSRSLLKCYEVGAQQFGWAERTPHVRSMRHGRLLMGMGVAATTYPANQNPASARVRLNASGVAEVEVATSDMGPGTYTSMTQVAADSLELPVERIHVSLGRSDFPPGAWHGGSQTMASVGSAVRAACLAAQDEAAKYAIADPRSPVFGAPLDGVEWKEGRIRRRGEISEGQSYDQIAASIGHHIEVTTSAHRDPDTARRLSMHAFGAVFVEVLVDPDIGTIRVSRAVGAYAIGRVINRRLALSQSTGGMIGGIGMALMERTVLDGRDGRPVNAHMADYLAPVNLDIPNLEAHFIEEDDPHINPLGVKGLGEIALVGMAPAIANAVFHATGQRIRDLPITVGKVL
jgi:xanthine dehydrogenase YagR molybdenum-binding subunit